MHQEQIPQVPVPDDTTWDEVPELLKAIIGLCEERFGQCPSLLVLEPLDRTPVPGYEPTLSEAPEELIVISVIPKISEAIFKALKRVEAHEPKFPDSPSGKTIKIAGHTTFKSVFQQMTDMPATVLSMTFPNGRLETASIIFLRTAFTISEFRREMSAAVFG